MSQLKLNFSVEIDPKEDLDKSVNELLLEILNKKEESSPDRVPATGKQCRYLRKLGYKGKPEILSKVEASAKISELEANQ